MAKSLENDADLININSEDVTLDCKSIFWNHIYYSYSSDLCYSYHSTYNNIEFDSSASVLIEVLQ